MPTGSSSVSVFPISLRSFMVSPDFCLPPFSQILRDWCCLLYYFFLSLSISFILNI